MRKVPGVWGAGTTMILHGLGGVLLLLIIAAMAVWRGLQRYRWRKNQSREVFMDLFTNRRGYYGLHVRSRYVGGRI